MARSRQGICLICLALYWSVCSCSCRLLDWPRPCGAGVIHADWPYGVPLTLLSSFGFIVLMWFCWLSFPSGHLALSPSFLKTLSQPYSSISLPGVLHMDGYAVSSILSDCPYALPTHLVHWQIVRVKNGQGLLRAVRETNDLIPYSSSPMSTYFMVSPINFTQAWDTWLLFALHAKGFDVRPPLFIVSLYPHVPHRPRLFGRTMDVCSLKYTLNLSTPSLKRSGAKRSTP